MDVFGQQGSTPNQCQPELRTEIYQPDYFSASITRPTISGNVTLSGGYGGTITIPTPNPTDISRVSLVRLTTMTHHYSTDMRLIWLQITNRGAGTITVSAPLNANLAPPGYYMIHVLDNSLVPSTARIINIQGTTGGGGGGPSQVTGLTVTPASATQLNLAWTANPTTENVDHYNVYRGTTAGFTVVPGTTVPLAQPTTNSFNDTGLTAGTAYYYRVAAQDTGGQIGAISTEISGTPSQQAQTPHSILLNGTSQYADAGTNASLGVGETPGSEASYSIWVNYTQIPATAGVIMRRGPTGSFVPYLGNNGVLGCDVHYNTANTDDFFNGGALTPNAWYNIIVTHSSTTGATVLYVNGQAVANSTKVDHLLNTGTAGPASRLLMGATPLSDVAQSEYFPGLLDEARVYNVALTAQEVSSLFAGSNVARGLVSRWTFNEGTGTVANDTGGVGGNNATLLPASSPPTWSTNVPTPLSTGTLPPSQVTGLTVTPASATQLNLAWTANPTTENVDHYNVYRGTTAGFTVVPGTTVPTAQPTTNSFNDTGLTAGTAYYYRVAAVEATGQIGTPSDEVPGSTIGPTQVTGLTVTPASATQLNLAWTANPTTENVDHYNVYRGTTAGFTVVPGTTVPTAQPTTNSFNDTGLTAGTAYYYRVAAQDTGGQIGAVSGESTSTTLPTPGATRYSILLNGTSQYADAGTNASLGVGETPGSEASYSIWVNYTQIPATAGVIMRRGPTGSFVPYLGNNGVLGCDVHYNTANTDDFFNGGALTPNAWYNIIVTHSSTTGATVLYVNGQAVANSTKVDHLLNTGTAGPASRLLMGATPLSDVAQSEYFPGLLDEARVYNVALTAQEVSSLFAGSNVARGLVSRWTFNEGTGTVANDTGGVGGNNATLLPASSPPTWSTNVPTPLSTGTLPPSQVTGLTVTPASATQLNLAWTANPTTENVDHYNVYRGTTAGFTVVPGTTVPTAQPTTNSFNDTGLTAGTAYYYRVAAVEATGEVGTLSTEATGTTTAGQAPTQVTGLTVTPASATQLNLAWTANPTTENVDHYNVYRGTTAGFTVVPGTTVPTAQPTTNSFNDTGLTAGTAYYYRVAAVNATGQIGNISTEATGTTTAGQAPTQVTGLTVTPASATQLNLAWTANPAAQNIVRYNVYRGTTAGFTVVPGTTVPTAQPTTNSFNDTGLTASTTYYYRVAAVNATGQIGTLSAEATGTTTASTTPSQVTGLTVTPASATRLNLAWTANPAAQNIVRYNVYRGTTAGFTVVPGTTVPLAQPTNNSYGNTGLTVSTAYYYRVAAVNTAGQIGALSAEVSGRTLPSQVTGLTVTPASATQLNLAWTAIPTAQNIDHYNVYRGTTNGFTVVPGTTVPIAQPTTNSYNNTGLTASTTYYYRVAAVNTAGGIGALSTQVSGRTLPSQVAGLTVTPASTTRLNLAWTANPTTEDIRRYYVYRGTTAGFTVVPGTTVPLAQPTNNSYGNTGLTVSTAYYYRVAAVNTAGGIGALSPEVSGRTLPSQVTGLTVTPASATQLNLAWTAIPTAQNIDHYNVYRGTTNGFTVVPGTTVPIAQPTTNSYNNTGLTASTTYYYRVAAVNTAGGIGALSTQVSRRTNAT